MRDLSSVELYVAAFLFVIVAMPARGQLARDLDIYLTGECPTVMSVILDGVDGSTARIPATLKDRGSCYWTAHTPETFDTDLAHFSLRVGVARTECHKSQPSKGRATLDFACCSGKPVRAVTIRTEPQMLVTYLRRVPGDFPDAKASPRTTPCVEIGSFKGDGMIDHVSKMEETLHLQLGLTEPDPRAIGLQIERLIHAAAKTPDGALAPYDVVHVVATQLVQGNRSAPTTSPNAIDVEVLKVKALQLKKLHVEAK